MKTARTFGLIGCILLLVGTANAGVTAIRQTLDYTHNGDSEEPWFIPSDIITDYSPYYYPYYRGMREDWGWTHDVRGHVPSDATGILSATLAINAWNIEDTSPEAPEIHVIYANGIKLGHLEPTGSRAWKTTEFDLPRVVLDQLWADKQVYIFMDIDTVVDMVSQRVTLEYSTLTVNYNVTGAGIPARLSVHRFWSEAIASYLYTAKAREKDKLVRRFSDVWVYQGIEYQALPPSFEPGSVPVYRFWSDDLWTHFYTIDPTERDELIDGPSTTWIYEGEAFWVFPPETRVPGTIPVYRFWSEPIRRHFYTTNEEQKDDIIRELANVWTYEGVVWRAFPYEPVE